MPKIGRHIFLKTSTSLDIIKKYRVELEHIINIWAKARLFYNDSLYLSTPKNSIEQSILSKNKALDEIRYLLWVSTVLELCKLFDDNISHSFNLFKFSRKINQDKNKSIFKNRLSSETIKKWNDKLYKPETLNTICRLKKLRDKYYAHSDRKPELLPEEITPEKSHIEELFLIGKEIINDFQDYVFDTEQDFYLPNMAGQILDNLVELAELKK